jgi:hypothetical protein
MNETAVATRNQVPWSAERDRERRPGSAAIVGVSIHHACGTALGEPRRSASLELSLYPMCSRSRPMVSHGNARSNAALPGGPVVAVGACGVENHVELLAMWGISHCEDCGRIAT